MAADVPLILVAGGDADSQILQLLGRLAERGIDHLPLLAGTSSAPDFTWDLGHDHLYVGGVEVRPTALFLRHDVYTHTASGLTTEGRRAALNRANRWWHALMQWALVHPEVAFLDRRRAGRYQTKIQDLHLAQRIGLAVPRTSITNDPWIEAGPDKAAWIVKPVDGGAFVRPLTDALADEEWRYQISEEPVMLQPRLVGPELRVHRVGGRWFAFEIRSGALDYRAAADEDVAIAAVPAPDALTGPLGRLMDALGLDFGAADFKTCPETGRYLFLEVNPQPMFEEFDRIAGNALADAVVDWLLANAQGQHRAEPGGTLREAAPLAGLV